MGMIISTFQSHEYGFGLEMSHKGTKYGDEEAAKARKGSPYKSALTSSPSVIKFSYGVNEQGNWNYEHMVTQLEDCIHCLTVFTLNMTFYSYLTTCMVMTSREKMV